MRGMVLRSIYPAERNFEIQTVTRVTKMVIQVTNSRLQDLLFTYNYPH